MCPNICGLLGFFKDLCNVMRQIISQDQLLYLLKRTPILSQQKDQNEEAQRQHSSTAEVQTVATHADPGSVQASSMPWACW